MLFIQHFNNYIAPIEARSLLVNLSELALMRSVSEIEIEMIIIILFVNIIIIHQVP